MNSVGSPRPIAAGTTGRLLLNVSRRNNVRNNLLHRSETVCGLLSEKKGPRAIERLHHWTKPLTLRQTSCSTTSFLNFFSMVRCHHVLLFMNFFLLSKGFFWGLFGRRLTEVGRNNDADTARTWIENMIDFVIACRVKLQAFLSFRQDVIRLA